MSDEMKVMNDVVVKMQQFYPRPQAARLLMKTPLVLWRLGLGPLSGFVFLILTTRGRKSGLPRRSVIEYHRFEGVKYAVSAFGERADWYRNIQAFPYITIQSSDGEEAVKVERISDDAELKKVFQLFMRRDAPLTTWYLRSLGIEPDIEDVLRNKDKIHFLRFNPVNAKNLPGIKRDLVWVWPILFLTALLLKFLFMRSKTIKENEIKR